MVAANERIVNRKPGGLASRRRLGVLCALAVQESVQSAKSVDRLSTPVTRPPLSSAASVVQTSVDCVTSLCHDDRQSRFPLRSPPLPRGSKNVVSSWLCGEKSVSGTQPLVHIIYQGTTLDSVTGLYYERNRNYSPSLGTWISQDPLQYINGANTYQFVMSDPAGYIDSFGLATDSFSYISKSDWNQVADDIEEQLEVDSMGGGLDGWTHNGAAKFVGRVLRGQAISHQVDIGSAKGALELVIKLALLLSKDNPTGWVAGALGFTGKNGIKLGIKLFENALQSLRARGVNETYRAFYQKKLCNGWNTGSIRITYNPFTGAFTGELIGNVGQISDAGDPTGHGHIHRFYFPFNGTLSLNNDHSLLMLLY